VPAPASSPTADKPESKLWFAYDTWWADMWSPSAAAHHIYKLNPATQAWSDTGVAIDARANTASTTLYDGNQLYIASHVIASSSSTAVTGKPTYLYRYTYANGTWTRDANFPVTIQPYSVESLSIDIDGAGRLWAAYTRGAKVYVTVSTGNAYGATMSFKTPWVPVVPGANTKVNADDIATVVTTAGGDILVLWSNQVDGAVDFARHAKGAADTTFTGGVATQGAKMADDHINLKALQSDAQGRVFAGVKTGLNDVATSPKTDPLLRLMVFKPATGTWSAHTFGTIADSHTRPLVLIDGEHNTVHMLATGPSVAGKVAFTGTIYEKVANLDNPVFPSGLGTPVIRDATKADMNNATSTRQPISSATGQVVMASHASSKTYWHMYAPLANTAPTARFTATPTSGNAPLTVNFTSTSTGSPSSWTWNFGDGTTSSGSGATASHTYSAGGTYQATLTVANANGSNTSAATAITVTAAGRPTAAFTASPTTGTAPLAVTFANTSTGATSYSWNFGDGSPAGTTAAPSHTFAAAGTITVTLTATNAAGTSTATQAITVSGAPGGSSTRYRVNAGGAAVAGSPGWTADTTASPSTYTNAAAAVSAAETNTKPIVMTNPSVPAGTPVALFGSDRYDANSGATMQWNFPVPSSGTYTVRLYFAETNAAAYGKGLRKFSVAAEGSTMLTSFDIYAEAGAKTALVKTLTVPVTDGTLNLNFIRIQNNPLVNGIEVIGPA
jgi:PKD repeat protein